MTMTYRFVSLLFAGLVGLATTAWAQESTPGTFYGETFTASDEAAGIARAMEDSTFHNATVQVEGTVLDVCQKKGCWMVVGEGDSQMRITFKDYSFFVPTDCSGKQVLVEGVVSVEEIPEDVAKHYAEESEHEDPDAISGPQRVITMVATGVRIAE